MIYKAHYHCATQLNLYARESEGSRAFYCKSLLPYCAICHVSGFVPENTYQAGHVIYKEITIFLLNKYPAVYNVAMFLSFIGLTLCLIFPTLY